MTPPAPRLTRAGLVQELCLARAGRRAGKYPGGSRVFYHSRLGDEQLQYIFFSGEEGYTCKRVQDTNPGNSGVSADGRYTLAVGVHQFYDA